MTKPANMAGKYPLAKLSQAFALGENVIFSTEPSIHKGMYFRRFHGKVGKVSGKRGRCYEVEIFDGNKKKMMIVNPVHLQRR